MKKSAIIVSLILCVVVVLSLIQVVVANRLSTTGIEVSKMQQTIRDYKHKNAILKEKILKEAAFTEIASKAATLGFVESKNNLYLSTPLPLAKR